MKQLYIHNHDRTCLLPLKNHREKLRNIARAHGIRRGRNKNDTINNLIASGLVVEFDVQAKKK